MLIYIPTHIVRARIHRLFFCLSLDDMRKGGALLLPYVTCELHKNKFNSLSYFKTINKLLPRAQKSYRKVQWRERSIRRWVVLGFSTCWCKRKSTKRLLSDRDLPSNNKERLQKAFFGCQVVDDECGVACFSLLSKQLITDQVGGAEHEWFALIV